MVVAGKGDENMARYHELLREAERKRDEESCVAAKQKPKARSTYREIEWGHRYRIVRIIHDSKRDKPWVVAIVKLTSQPTAKREIIIFERPGLPKLTVDSELWLTEYRFGDSSFWAETLPR